MIIVAGLVILALTSGIVNSDPFTTKKWSMPKGGQPFRSGYAKGDVAFQSNKGRNGEATADKASLNSNINVQNKGNINAKRVPGTESAVATNFKGDKATVDQSKKKEGLRTGDAAGKYKGELRNSKQGNDQRWDSKLNTGHEMKSVMHGNKESFDAEGNKGHKYNVDPKDQSKTSGTGTITRDGEKFDYKENRASNGDVNAQLTNVGKGPSRKTYTCQGQKQGVSNCVDQNGLKYGEVVSQPDGTVIVKKTIAKGVDVPIAQSKVTRDKATGKSVASVNNGMFQAQAGNYKERDCMADYGKRGGSKIKIEKPFKVNYNSQTQGGKRTFQFPDCVTFSGKLTLPPGVDANRIALQWEIMILPAGIFKCVDPGSCNKDCYYCNFCNNTRKVNALDNADKQQVCNLKGGVTVEVSVTACPPPDAFNKGLCSGFTKSDPNYFKKKGDLQATLKIFERPADEAQVKAYYYNNVKNNQILMFPLKAQYQIENKQFINANAPTDFDLAEFYIKKNSKSKGDELIGCIQGTTNYTMSSQKVRTDFLLEAGSIAAAPKSLFDTKKCPQVDQINQDQANADAQEAAKSKPAGGSNAWGNFGKFFGGRRR